ncbi:hypothetical protein LTR85_000988 [Meristemomyces frigidus]|nr:hypothetical protein LTR85_000988 [Meristemomyces frigidus]
MGGLQAQEQASKQHYKDWPNEAAFNANANRDDVRNPLDIPVVGRFPGYVAGALYRTGPGAYKIDSAGSNTGVFTVGHWFDGFTTTHKFNLQLGADGSCDKVSYSSFMQGSRDPLFSNVGVVLRETLPVEAASIDEQKRVGRRLITITTDTITAKHIDADTLEPLSITTQATIHPSLTGQMSAAHASHDLVTGEIFNYNLTLGPTHCYKIFRASPAGETEVLAEIKGRDVRGAYLHSLLLTEHYVVLCVWPAYFTKMGLGMLWERNVVDSLKFDPSAKTQWYAVDRKHGRGLVSRKTNVHCDLSWETDALGLVQVKQFTSPSFFCFHTVNTCEEQGTSDDVVDIVCELVEMPNANILELLRYEYIVSSEAAHTRPVGGVVDQSHPTLHLVRHRLEHIAAKRWSTDSPVPTKKIMSVFSGDLPRINPRYELKPHRYVYTTLNRGKASFFDGIGKTDMQAGTTTVWEEARHTPGEPIFIPRPDATEEDDGVVLVVVFDGDASTSYLLCLDAKTLTEVARATVSKPIGLGFHGVHRPTPDATL